MFSKLRLTCRVIPSDQGQSSCSAWTDDTQWQWSNCDSSGHCCEGTENKKSPLFTSSSPSLSSFSSSSPSSSPCSSSSSSWSLSSSSVLLYDDKKTFVSSNCSSSCVTSTENQNAIFLADLSKNDQNTRVSFCSSSSVCVPTQENRNTSSSVASSSIVLSRENQNTFALADSFSCVQPRRNQNAFAADGSSFRDLSPEDQNTFVSANSSWCVLSEDKQNASAALLLCGFPKDGQDRNSLSSFLESLSCDAQKSSVLNRSSSCAQRPDDKSTCVFIPSSSLISSSDSSLTSSDLSVLLSSSFPLSWFTLRSLSSELSASLSSSSSSSSFTPHSPSSIGILFDSSSSSHTSSSSWDVAQDILHNTATPTHSAIGVTTATITPSLKSSLGDLNCTPVYCRPSTGYLVCAEPAREGSARDTDLKKVRTPNSHNTTRPVSSVNFSDYSNQCCARVGVNHSVNLEGSALDCRDLCSCAVTVQSPRSDSDSDAQIDSVSSSDLERCEELQTFELADDLEDPKLLEMA